MVNYDNKTFIMVKPDGVQRGLISAITQRFEQKGFKLVAMKFVKPSQAHFEAHYADLKTKPFFGGLVKFMQTAPVLAMVWEGTNAATEGRKLLGATKPSDSAPGTIRGDFAMDIGRNIIHGSDSAESAKKEIELWFPEGLVEWTPAASSWVYDMPSYSGLERHAGKAASHVKFADKAYVSLIPIPYSNRLEVSFFKLKFRPDYFLAATEMNEAAQAYQLAKMETQSKAAYIRSAELRLKDNDHQSAARCYDQAGEFDKAADCYMICGGIDQAVRSIMRKPGGDLKCFEKAIELYSKDETKDILASDIYKQYITKLLLAEDYEKYFQVSEKYQELLIRIEQWPFVYKELLSRVIVRVATNELVGAERILDSKLNTNGFLHSAEYAAADDLISAIRENDATNLKKVVARPTVLYVNTEVVKLAKKIKTVPLEVGNTDVANVDALLM